MKEKARAHARTHTHIHTHTHTHTHITNARLKAAYSLTDTHGTSSAIRLSQAVMLLTYIGYYVLARILAGTPPRMWCQWFSSVSPSKCRGNTFNYDMTLSFRTLSNSLFTIIYAFDCLKSELLV